ncbi:hypothetical protein POTOM_061483 [Populus tomentosa]|uniref:TPX2 C-terminal domain-containing protein n=1 Tax=Populus tomentosa TaxID=118781 RepID=A0A8X7XM31_POPTO|nr:hypothetical protein POTOM_061483 [Populus tomentosa]
MAVREIHGFLKCDASSINVVAVAVFISEENFSCGMESDQITYAYTADTLVFSHNRCRQEELEKFKAPGLVAQKKAYFEEYYKKFRAMKGLQAEQETTQTYSYQNGQEITTREENGVDTEASKRKENLAILILDNHTTGNISPSRRGINDGVEEESYLNGSSGGASKEDEIGLCFSARIISIYSMEDGSSSCTPSVKSSSKTRQKGSPGTVASAANRTKSDCRMSKDVVKPSEKPKPSVCKEITSKADVSLVSGKRITTKTASNKRSDQRSSKEMTTISHLRKFSVDNRICDGFGQRSLGLSGHHILPKSRESESQRPKVVLKNLPDRDKSNQNTGLERRPISFGLDEIDARIGPKSDPSKGTGSQRTSNLKPVNKIVTSQSIYLTRQKDSRMLQNRFQCILKSCRMGAVSVTAQPWRRKMIKDRKRRVEGVP